MYVTSGEYTGVIPPMEAEKWLELASLKIDALTFGRIKRGVTPYQEELIKKATIHEAEYLYQANEDGSLDENVSGWSVSGISMSYNDQTGTQKWLKDNNISKTCYELLNLTGLMWRGL